jgi:hypothetical protein
LWVMVPSSGSSANSVLAKTGPTPGTLRNSASFSRQGEKVALEYRVRHLERLPLGTPYTEVVDRIVELVKALGGNPVLAVDATGVGRPVIDMLWKTLGEELEGTDIYIDHCAVTITGGDSVTRNPDGGLKVPKRDLITATLVLLQNGHSRSPKPSP